LRIPENLMELADAKSRSERTNRASALRQLLYAGAEDYAMGLLAEGRISVGKAAELLDTTVQRVHQLSKERGVEIGANLEAYRRSRRSISGLLGYSYHLYHLLYPTVYCPSVTVPQSGKGFKTPLRPRPRRITPLTDPAA
jgi:predicted HTH domain antitoxin